MALAGVLAVAAALKLADARSSQAGLATFGLASPAARRVAFVAIVAWELALALGVAAGLDVAAFAAAVTLLAFAAVLAVALRRGAAGLLARASARARG
ncbi:MAG: MauE/DoxX family redox-associated membrane protein [Thermoleophilaceae bacterium]